MSRRKLLLAGAAVTLGLVAGASGLFCLSGRGQISADRAAGVRKGMTEREVERLLGCPGKAADQLPEDVYVMANGWIPDYDMVPKYQKIWLGPNFALCVGFDESGVAMQIVQNEAFRIGLWKKVKMELRGRRLLP